MADFSENNDRRSKVRFQVEGNAVLGPVPDGLAELIELSLEGFSFRHNSDRDIPPETRESLTLFGEETVCLGTVPLQKVSEQVEENGLDDLPLRRCGMKFGQLTKSQATSLQHFIYRNAYFEV